MILYHSHVFRWNGIKKGQEFREGREGAPKLTWFNKSGESIYRTRHLIKILDLWFSPWPVFGSVHFYGRLCSTKHCGANLFFFFLNISEQWTCPIAVKFAHIIYSISILNPVHPTLIIHMFESFDLLCLCSLSIKLYFFIFLVYNHKIIIIC